MRRLCHSIELALVLAALLVVVADSAHAADGAEKPLRSRGSGRRSSTRYQDRYFEALQHLDAEIAQHYRVDERELDSLHLLHRPRRVLGRRPRALLPDASARGTRRARRSRGGRRATRCATRRPIRLARIHFQKGQPEAALHAARRACAARYLRDDPRRLSHTCAANLYLATGQAAEAVDVLRGRCRVPRRCGDSRRTTSASRCCRTVGSDDATRAARTRRAA